MMASCTCTGTPHFSKLSWAAAYQSSFSSKISQLFFGFFGGVVAQETTTAAQTEKIPRTAISRLRDRILADFRNEPDIWTIVYQPVGSSTSTAF